MEKWRSTLLGQASTATDISIGAERLENVDASVHIFHGTGDEVVGVDNSRKIVKALQDSDLTVVENTGHSFSGREAELADQSVRELNKVGQNSAK